MAVWLRLLFVVHSVTLLQAANEVQWASEKELASALSDENLECAVVLVCASKDSCEYTQHHNQL